VGPGAARDRAREWNARHTAAVNLCVAAALLIAGCDKGVASDPSRVPVAASGSSAAPQPSASAAPQPSASAVASNLVTQSDAEALLGGFLIACDDPASYSLAGSSVPCAKEDRGRIYDVNGHYCADDWHVVSSQLVDTKANLEKYQPQQSVDGVVLQTTRTPIRPIDPAYSQQHFGGQYYYIQIGVVLSPQQISAGKHTLRQFAPGYSFDRQIPFTIDRSGTGVCAGT
jgi:hypothetical protein